MAAPVVVAGNAAVASLEDKRGQDPPARNKPRKTKTKPKANQTKPTNKQKPTTVATRPKEIKRSHQLCKVSAVESAETAWDDSCLILLIRQRQTQARTTVDNRKRGEGGSKAVVNDDEEFQEQIKKVTNTTPSKLKMV